MALVDQRALAGIGNVYKSEVLWIERVSPFRPVRDVDDETLERLVATARVACSWPTPCRRTDRAGDDDGRPRRTRAAVRLPANGPAVPPLPDRDPLDAAGP